MLRRCDVATDVQRALSSVQDPRLHALPFTLRFWDGSVLAAGGAIQEGEAPTAHIGDGTPLIAFNSPLAISYLLREPNQLGLARAWVTGAVDVAGDLDAVLAMRHRLRRLSVSRSERLRLAASTLRIAGPALLRRPPVPAIEARHRGRLHSLARDRQAVTHHYDVSNRFYRMVLGPSLTYSCAYFTSEADSLEEAQQRKHDVICRKLQLTPGERLLDIGCGWGSLLLHAVAHYGVRGVGVTLSEAQAELARQRIQDAGYTNLIEVRVADYREITDPPFDKIASIGMYEHLGRTELGRYAATVARVLRPGGLFLNHGIARLEYKPTGPDLFISRYIFPDGDLHPVTYVMDAMRAAGLEVRDVESLREHYPLTLRCWLANLRTARAQAIAEVGEERERAWRLYMAGSAQGFEDGELTVYQVLCARTGKPHRLPLDRTALLGSEATEVAVPRRSRVHTAA